MLALAKTTRFLPLLKAMYRFARKKAAGRSSRFCQQRKQPNNETLWPAGAFSGKWEMGDHLLFYLAFYLGVYQGDGEHRLFTSNS
jgi:hypothetical protein